VFAPITIKPLFPACPSSPRNTVFMVLQKSLSHSPLSGVSKCSLMNELTSQIQLPEVITAEHSYRMVYAAPSLRLLVLRPSISRFWAGCLEKSASSLAVVKAARGGLDGGESQRLLWRTSGKPLGPYRQSYVSIYFSTF